MCSKIQKIKNYIHAGMERIIFLVLICWYPKSGMASVRGQCTEISRSVQEQVLKKHTIHTMPARSIDECMVKCLDHPRCHSSNFYREHKMCDLNDRTHTSHPEDMAPVPYSNYMENIFRPFLCSQDSDCGEGLVCSPSLECTGECGQLRSSI